MRPIPAAVAGLLFVVLGGGALGAQSEPDLFRLPDLLPSFSGKDVSHLAVYLTEEGYLARPRPRLLSNVSLHEVAKEVGIEPANIGQGGEGGSWSLPSGPARSEQLGVRATRFPTPMAARQSFLAPNLSVLPRWLSVGDYLAAHPEGKTAPVRMGGFGLLPDSPVAGEVCEVDAGHHLAFVRDNYIVDIYATAVINGQVRAADGTTAQKVRELAKKIDEYLLKAPAKEIEDEWLPRIEGVSVELPSPVVGKPFRLDARVSLHGKPCPTGRMRFDWRLFRKEELQHQVLYSAKQKTEPGPTSVLYTVDRPGWWEVQCDVSYDESPVESRKMLLYVAAESMEGTSTE